MALVVGAILYKNRRYKRYLKMKFQLSKLNLQWFSTSHKLHLQFHSKFFLFLSSCKLPTYCAELDEFDVKPTIYSYQELKVATRDFHEENKLGQGGYGAVYKVTYQKPKGMCLTTIV